MKQYKHVKNKNLTIQSNQFTREQNKKKEAFETATSKNQSNLAS